MQPTELVSLYRAKALQLVPFFGHLMLKLEPDITEEVQLAGVTRCGKLRINPNWLLSTSSEEAVATLIHETLHVALRVWLRQGDRKAVVQTADGATLSLWNIAHDYAINDLIVQMSSKDREILSPERWHPAGLYNHLYRDMSAEEIYDLLREQVQQPPPSSGSGRGPSLSGVSLQSSHGDVQPGSAKEDGPLADMTESEEDNYWKVAIVEAAQIHEQNQQAGQLPGRIKKMVKEITEPRVSWVDALSQWMGENGNLADFSYRRPNRRSEAVGAYLASTMRYGVDDIVVLWDTSGSMDQRETEILSEVIGICDDLGLSLRVICCDSGVCSDQSEVTSPEDVDVKGGGGSNFIPAFELLDDEGYTGVVVAFTDGYIRVPKLKPVHLRDCLWVIWGRDVDPTKGAWGEVLNVDESGFAS